MKEAITYKSLFIILRSTYMRVAVGLALIVAIAYLLFSARFGLYSDDVFLYSLLDRHDGNVLQSAFNFSLGYAGEGRPLGQVALMLLFWLGNTLAGVKGLYFLGGALLWVQVMLAFAALRHFASIPVAFLSAAAYIVFPADVARFLPVHALDSQFAAIAFWGALLFFLANRFLLATLLISSTLLFYETHWLLAWGFPILLIAKGKSIKEALRAGSRYILYLMATSGSIIYWRLAFAPGRAAQRFEDPNLSTTLARVVDSALQGFRASAGTLVKRPLDFLQNGDSVAWVVALISFLTILFISLSLEQAPRQTPSSKDNADQSDGQLITISSLAAFGLFAWLASYPLYGVYTDRFPPVIITGRLSNIHTPAAIGFVFVLVYLLLVVMRVIAKGYRSWLKTAVFVTIALYVSTLVGFFVVNQTRYVKNWEYQVDFWKKLALVTSDVQSSTLIVIEGTAETNQLYEELVFDWTLPYLTAYMWHLNSKQVPLVLPDYMVRQYGTVVDGQLRIVGYPTIGSRSFQLDHVLGVQLFAGRLYRTRSHGPASRIVANNYSDKNFKNGILVKDGRSDVFFFLAGSETSNPVKKGDVVVFAGSGTAEVKKVDVSPQGTEVAILVTVDHDLDPSGDGFPNPILVLK